MNKQIFAEQWHSERKGDRKKLKGGALSLLETSNKLGRDFRIKRFQRTCTMSKKPLPEARMKKNDLPRVPLPGKGTRVNL